MANKSVYQVYNADALTHFDLTGDPKYGLLVGDKFEEVLCTQDQTTYEKVESLLKSSTENAQTFRNKKKAFILPKCAVSQDRLKAALREHSITVTNDYEKADLIVGHDNITCASNNGENIPSTVMMTKLWNYELTNGASSTTSPLATKIKNLTCYAIITSKVIEKVNYYNLDICDTSLYDSWMLTGMALNIAHLIETTDLSVIDSETILRSSANMITLDEQLLKDLKSQLNSGYHSEDKVLAAKIIPTIDYKTNYHLLWELGRECNNLFHDFNRDKDLWFWIEESKLRKFSNKSAQEMILWLEVNDLLSRKNFKYLEPIVRREISIHNRDLYTFKVSVKKEYLKYLQND
tara:strand:+ start:657 stop:1703 length:1047 start_codon:yes stop_codon:yes gene_type:complete